MVKLVNKFIKDIELKLMGQSELIDMEHLSAGAYINYKLNTEVQSNLRLDLVPDDQEMTILITNLNGLRGSISFPSLSLDCVNRKLIAQFEYPLEKCVDCIHGILEEAVNESAALVCLPRIDGRNMMFTGLDVSQVNCRLRKGQHSVILGDFNINCPPTNWHQNIPRKDFQHNCRLGRG
ncbi:dynamin-2 [Caerostris extrusa]|uniref:Dynamin-2 n=1 Tax=Caerostris extrusa TaxID=172846 RepID=A0AAV4XQG6_CAEEX|nr:dynamin-2 [Caerostris extrusa]